MQMELETFAQKRRTSPSGLSEFSCRRLLPVFNPSRSMLDDGHFLAAGISAPIKLPLMQHFLSEGTVPLTSLSQVDDKSGSE